MSNVSHPSHYNSGKIEVIEFIEDQKLDYPCGNAVKYICRAGKKDPSKEIEDLEKATWYLKRKIETLTAALERREPVRPNAMNPQIAISAIDALSGGQPELKTDSAIPAMSRVCARCGNIYGFHSSPNNHCPVDEGWSDNRFLEGSKI